MKGRGNEETMTTKLTPEQKQLLKDELCVEIAGLLMDDYKYSPEEAIDVLYTSETFDRLQDDAQDSTTRVLDMYIHFFKTN